MKLQQYILPLAIILFSGLLQAQSRNNGQEQLVGNWILNYELSFSKVDKSSGSKWSKISEENRLKIKKSYKGRQFHLKSDGNYAIILSNGKTATGKWLYNPNTKQIDIRSVKGGVTLIEVVFLNENNIVLQPKALGNREYLFPDLFYTKN